MSCLTLVLMYSFCKNPISPPQQLVFSLEWHLEAEVLKPPILASLSHPGKVISTVCSCLEEKEPMKVLCALLLGERAVLGMERVCRELPG